MKKKKRKTRDCATLFTPPSPPSIDFNTIPYFTYGYPTVGVKEGCWEIEAPAFFFYTMGCLERALSLDGTLDLQSRHVRKLFFIFHCVALASSCAFTLIEVLTFRGSYVFLAGLIGCVLCSFCSVLAILLKYELTTLIMVSGAALCAITLLVSDLSARTEYGYVWPMMVLLVDYLLVLQLPTRYSTFAVVCTLVYLFVVSAEQMWRFGLFDMPGLMPQQHRRSYRDGLGDCDLLPCKQSNAVKEFMMAAAVFLLDFIATRGFARGLLKEQASMKRTIATVQDIASLLAGYDVEQVAELLEEHGGELPEGMTTALRKLEKNLRVYKAYLPQTCLPFQDEKERVEPGELDDFGSTDPSTVSAATSSTSAVRPISFHSHPLLLSSRKATLLTLNIKDTLHRLEEDSARFSDLFTTVLLQTLQATDSRRGMVDVFVGDRIHCSFNTSKQCASHATSALHAASLMKAGLAASVNVGVATGKVLRGDMGCEVMRRFSMVGTLVRDVHGMERAGRMLGCDILCNRLCFSDAECEHDLRLIPCKVEVARDCEPEVVAELVSKEQKTYETDEWMYQIGGEKHWDRYNTVVRGYLRGESCDTDVAKAWEEAGGSGTPAHAVPSGTCSGLCCYLR